VDGVSVDAGELERRVRRLEDANAALLEANLRLARGRLGSSEAAAASTQARLDLLREQLAEAIRVRDARIEELTEIAARNDALYRQQLAWNDAARYRAADRVVALGHAIPGLRAMMRTVRRIAALLGRGG
jgi:hypothetical protein